MHTKFRLWPIEKYIFLFFFVYIFQVSAQSSAVDRQASWWTVSAMRNDIYVRAKIITAKDMAVSAATVPRVDNLPCLWFN